MKDFEKQKQVYEKRLDRAKQEKELHDIQAQVREVKKTARRFTKPTTTKLLIAYIFIDCTVIQIYSLIAMWHFGDLTALLYLIPAVVTEAISFAVYCAKAYNETKQEENVKLEREKMQIEQTISAEGAKG